MFEWSNLILLVATAALSGVLLTLLFVPRGTRWSMPLAFVALLLGVIVTGWIGLLLAEFGLFGRWSLAAALAMLAGAMLVWRLLRRPSPPSANESSGDNWALWEWLMLGVWLVAALWLFFRPHEYIYGGADAGVYVSLGAEIAQNGGFRIVDEALAGLPAEMRAAVMRPLPNTPGASAYLWPGFYVTDAAAGRLTPQFYPLHPVLQAAAFSVTGGGASGIRAELLLTGLWMLLGTLAVYLTARDVGGPIVGALALAGLSLSALQVWFGRYPTSEALTQFLLWAGIWSAGRWLGERRPPRLWPFAAGCAFGAVFLVRIDSLVLLPLFSLFLVWRWAQGRRRDDAWFAVPFTVLVIHSLLHGHFLSAPYFYETVGYGVFLLTRLWPVLVGGIIIGFAVLWWLPRLARNLGFLDRFKRPALLLLVAVLLTYAFYGWFLRPELGQTTLRPDVFSGGEIPVTNSENWPRLGWYLTPLGVWLGVLGCVLLTWRVDRRTVLLLAIGWVFTILYLWNISANPHHVYVMRRYVPAVMPFLILGGAYLLGRRGFSRAAWSAGTDKYLSKIPFPILSTLFAVVAAVWLAGLGWAARGFVSQVDNAGLTPQLDALASRLPPGAVLLFDDQSTVGQGDFWGTPLRFVYNFDAFTLRQAPADISAPLVETIKTWQNNGRPVVWIGGTDWLDEQGFVYRTEQVVLSSDRLESSYDHKPRDIVSDESPLMLNFLERN